jgi:MOSC domain-containing protein YiiM
MSNPLNTSAVVDTLSALRAQHAQPGRLTWIGARPARDAAMLEVEQAQLLAGKGLVGDRFRAGGKREVSLIQAEHLPIIAALLGRVEVAPAILRRNLAVAGINVLALCDQRFRIGEVLLQGSGSCEPCQRMERALGAGGYNAMCGHGGITARVLEGGVVRLGDRVVRVADHTETSF